jgi:ArsR family transcriptional regulator, virulence genes transcriptional regulator
MAMRKVRASMEDVDRMAESVSRASAFLKSPANPSRLPILCHLAEGGMSVSEFEDVLELRQQTSSQQLARLREDPLGKIIYCRLAYNEVIVLFYELRPTTSVSTDAPNDAGQ